MRRSTIIRDERSVLNVDAFDIRRFQEIFQLSEELQRVREESGFPAIESLLRDIWASLYKMKPFVRRSDVPASLELNRTFLRELMQQEQFDRYRAYTKLDDLTSAICTSIIGDKLNGWLMEIQEGDAELEQQLETVRNLQDEWAMDDIEETVEREATEELNEAAAELDDKLDMAFDTNRERFANLMDEAMDKTIHMKEGLISLMGGTSTGKGEADMRKVPLREKLALADKLAADQQMKTIAEWAGRFKEIAHRKKRKEYIDAPERRGVMRGSDLERLLPAELGLYTHPVAKLEFLRKFAEGETMQYDQKKRADAGKGPIVFCLDQSGSMSELDNQAKGFILALLSIARQQGRDVSVILFSTAVQRFTYSKGRMTAAELARMAQTYAGGGTDFTVALEEALQVLADSAFKKGDVIFVTDGEETISEAFAERFNKRKKEKEFQVLSLVMGKHPEAVSPFSDRTFHVTGFDEEGSYTAFEI